MQPSVRCSVAAAALALFSATPALAENIFTVAGNGTSGSGGDNGRATRASLVHPVDVTVDAAGNLFILDDLARTVRRVTPAGMITTVAVLPDVSGKAIAVDTDGTLFVAMGTSLRRIAPTGAVTTYAETATGLAFDRSRNLYMADPSHDRIRRLAANGSRVTVAGTTKGFCGDGGPATQACLNAPNDVSVGLDGYVYIADTGNGRIRRLESDGTISSPANAGNWQGNIEPHYIAAEADGSLFFSETDIVPHVSVQEFSPYGGWGVAGNGVPGYGGDGGPAVNAQLAGIRGMFLGPGGNLYIADGDNHRVRRIRLGNAAGVADVDANLASDVVWRNHRTGANALWRGAQSALSLTTVSNLDWNIVGIGDFDGAVIDDRLNADLLWRNARTGANVIWRAGTSSTQQAVTGVTNLDWQVAGVGDFDGDGKADILWHNAVSGQNVIWKRAVSSSQQVLPTVNTAWQIAGIGDFWGDGKADILWRNQASGDNVIWRSGNSTTQQAVSAAAPEWQVAGIGDFDGDGRSDILWHKAATGANAIWLSADAGTPRAMAAIGLAWTVAAIGDYDADTRSDVMFRNTSTGANVYWRGADATSSVALPNAAVPDWVPVH